MMASSKDQSLVLPNPPDQEGKNTGASLYGYDARDKDDADTSPDDAMGAALWLEP